MAKWTDQLKVSDMPEQYQQLARTIGVQNLLKLADEYGGDKPYIPKRDALLRVARDRLIKKQFTGYNAKELARYYGLTDRWVIKLCKGDDGGEEPEETVSREPQPPPPTEDNPADRQFVLWGCR